VTGLLPMEFASPQWVDRITSTNTALVERLAAGERLPSGYVLATTDQTAGRGRGQHRWTSQPGRDLCCSFVLQAPVEPGRLCSLSMATAVGVVDCLESFGIEAQTKWPNDVVVNDRKITGILPELASGAPPQGTPRMIVVGVGLNIGMSAAEAAAQIDQPATSLFIETARTPLPKEVLAALLLALVPRIDEWIAHGFSGQLKTAWEDRCIGIGRQVTIAEGNRSRSGNLAGFGTEGQLLLEEDTGTSEVWSGTLRLGRK
jgi:BirA family biotin operon repressor/biotin-[acetyl-CoA-carboxylase] ligase